MTNCFWQASNTETRVTHSLSMSSSLQSCVEVFICVDPLIGKVLHLLFWPSLQVSDWTLNASWLYLHLHLFLALSTVWSFTARIIMALCLFEWNEFHLELWSSQKSDAVSQVMCILCVVFCVCVLCVLLECWCLINFILRNFPGIPCFWWSQQYDHLMSVLPVSGWLLGKNKAADQEKGDSCLIHSMDLNPVGVQHFLIEGLECWVFCVAWYTWFSLGMLLASFINLIPITILNDSVTQHISTYK